MFANSVDEMKMNRSHRNSRVVSSDFSIERILALDGEKIKSRPQVPCSQAVTTVHPDEDTSIEKYVDSKTTLECHSRLSAFSNVESSNVCQKGFPERLNVSHEATAGIHPPSATPNTYVKNFVTESNELPWLQCTRYRPPKLPRKSSAGKGCKRRPGAHPRIPFTTIQIQILEDKYRSTPYLSRRDVLLLSTTLRLPQSRVKIWFQNRRARDRRETGGGNVTIVSSDASLLHETSYVRPAERSGEFALRNVDPPAIG